MWPSSLDIYAPLCTYSLQFKTHDVLAYLRQTSEVVLDFKNDLSAGGVFWLCLKCLEEKTVVGVPA